MIIGESSNSRKSGSEPDNAGAEPASPSINQKLDSPLDRSKLLFHWDSLPEDQYKKLLQAWSNCRSCFDCEYWEIEPPQTVVGVCGASTLGTLIAPADYTCNQFKPK